MGLSKNFQEKYVLYGGDVVLNFDPGPHKYTLEHTGEVVPSTTSITGVIDKPALINWAVSQTTEYIHAVWEPGRKYFQKAIDAILEAASKARHETSQEAIDIGNMVHEWLEAYGRAYLSDSDHMPLMPEDPRAVASCEAFLQWVKKNDVVFLATEQKVYSLEHGYSGTFDLLARVNGKLSLLDYKSSKRIYEEYFLQGAGLSLIHI